MNHNTIKQNHITLAVTSGGCGISCECHKTVHLFHVFWQSCVQSMNGVAGLNFVGIELVMGIQLLWLELCLLLFSICLVMLFYSSRSFCLNLKMSFSSRWIFEFCILTSSVSWVLALSCFKACDVKLWTCFFNSRTISFNVTCSLIICLIAIAPSWLFQGCSNSSPCWAFSFFSFRMSCLCLKLLFATLSSWILAFCFLFSSLSCLLKVSLEPVPLIPRLVH